ncbi:MAG: PKD domain-containing protein, partial [Candidatus Diapherotrites archaeon]
MIFCLLSFSALTPAMSVSVKKVSPDSLKFEGDLFEFTAEVQDASGTVSFEWDFGDGNKLSTTEPRAMHNYYLWTNEQKKNFTVKATAIDSAGQSGEGSIQVTVEKSALKAIIKSPITTPANPLKKGEEAELIIEVLSFSNSRISVSTLKGTTATIGGSTVELSDNGYSFKGKILSKYSFKNTELLEVRIVSGIKTVEQKFPVYFAPAEILVSDPLSGKNFYFGVPFGKIQVGLSLPDGQIPTGGEFNAKIIAGGAEIERKKLDKNGLFFEADFASSAAGENYASLFFTVWGNDSSGNLLSEKEFQISIKKDNPLFNVSIDSPNPKQKTTLKAGQPVKVSASFESPSEAEDVKLWVFIPSLRKKYNLSSENGVFSGDIEIPASASGKITLLVCGTAKVQNTVVGDFEEVEFAVSRELLVSFVYPSAGQVVQQGEGKTLTVAISMPDGKPLQKNNYQGILYIDGESQSVVLNKSENNNYTITLNKPLSSGKHSLKLVLSNVDGLKGTAEVNTEITQAFDWFGIALLAIVLIALAIFANFVRSQLKTGQAVKKGPAKPKTEIELIRDEKKKLEIEFYKRRISEEEYNE